MNTRKMHGLRTLTFSSQFNEQYSIIAQFIILSARKWQTEQGKTIEIIFLSSNAKMIDNKNLEILDFGKLNTNAKNIKDITLVIKQLNY